VVAVMLGCIAVNVLGRALVAFLGMALFLDMIGTAAAAIALGPWWGAAVGLTSNLLGTTVSGSESIPFAVVNVAGALVWGYGVRSRRFTRSLPSFVWLNALVALVCTMAAVPIVLTSGAGRGHGTSRMAEVVMSFGPSLLVALYSTNLVMSLADKLICGLIALTVVEFLPGRSLVQEMTGSVTMGGGRTVPTVRRSDVDGRVTHPARGGFGPPPGTRRVVR
jgi:energy-coupling factor transport system substrate-specific component